MSEAASLLERADRSPDAIALETAKGTLSFAQLAGRTMRAAEFLRRVDAPTDGPVALLMDGDADFAAWFEAVGLAGRVAIPLNLRLTSTELARQVNDARAALVLGAPGDPRLDDLAVSVSTTRAAAVPRLDALPGPAARPTGAWPGAAPCHADTRAVLFTSGTSGRARGACLSWVNFLARARAAEERLGAAVRERWLACMPLFHVGGLSILVRSVLFGGPVRLLPRFDPAAVSDALDAGDVAGVSLVPTMLSRLLAHRGDRPAPPGLRVVLLGGAAASPPLLERALEAGYPVCPTYGLTEATSQVATAAPPGPGAKAPGRMRPLSGTEVRIIDDGRVQPAGIPGEIVVRGPTVMQGYLNDADATREALRDGWLHTGDVGVLDDELGLQVLDRREDLVVTGGENVYPAEVESVLLGHPSVLDAGVAGLPDPDLGKRIAAWIVLVPGGEPDPDTWRSHCRRYLAGYKVPREFRCVEALPRNATGKLLRRRLADGG